MKTLIITIALIITSSLLIAQTISDKEKASILRMREEEKMARDVYLTLNEKWQQTVFSNIAESESYHMAQMKLLVDQFKLRDPVTMNKDKRGVFENKDLQKMYNELTTSGKTSLEEALRAGAKIEEQDINDLREAIANTSNTGIKSTYQYLVRASENHMRAFVRNLKRSGFIYEPVILSKDDFNKIIDARPGNMGRGRNR